MAAYAPLVKVDGKYVLLDAADTLDLTTGQKAAIISNLNDLTDVVIAAVADGDVLSYDSGTSHWVNVAGGGGGGGAGSAGGAAGGAGGLGGTGAIYIISW